MTEIFRHILPISISGSQHNLDTLIHRQSCWCWSNGTDLLADIRDYIRAKQYEPINLHSLMQGLRINDFTWLIFDKIGKTTAQEMEKRRGLVQQFILWIFDGYLMPLLRVSIFQASPLETARFIS